MITYKRFKLERATLAVGESDGQRLAVTVPAGAIVKVVPGSSVNSGLIDVFWDGRALEMFAIDVQVRGTEVIEPKNERAHA